MNIQEIRALKLAAINQQIAARQARPVKTRKPMRVSKRRLPKKRPDGLQLPEQGAHNG